MMTTMKMEIMLRWWCSDDRKGGIDVRMIDHGNFEERRSINDEATMTMAV